MERKPSKLYISSPLSTKQASSLSLALLVSQSFSFIFYISAKKPEYFFMTGIIQCMCTRICVWLFHENVSGLTRERWTGGTSVAVHWTWWRIWEGRNECWWHSRVSHSRPLDTRSETLHLKAHGTSRRSDKHPLHNGLCACRIHSVHLQGEDTINQWH